ncbi:MAG: prolipoprotein diacylglyceryl transferase [Alphaproteobacteria bacterium]
MEFPQIDPIAFSIGPVAIRWYALAYLAAFLVGWRVARRLATAQGLGIKPVLLDDLLTWMILGVVLGGRLGYVLFYNPGYYLDNPAEIIAIWTGGMSFHGGMLGAIAAIFGFAWRNNLPLLSTADVVAVVTPIGLFFGRLANFINGELWGRVTEAPWGIVFPGGGPLPRHPSQLYQAAGEGLILFAILLLIWRIPANRRRPGLCGGVFVAGYGIARFAAEFVREPDAHLGTVFMGLTMGQLLSVPMVVVGAAFALRALRNPPLDTVKPEPAKAANPDGEAA